MSAESVEPRASILYLPVSCCRCTSIEAGGGEDEGPAAAELVDLEFNDRFRRVRGFMRRIYRAVSIVGGGNASVA
jgi:hypothetical protein